MDHHVVSPSLLTLVEERKSESRSTSSLFCLGLPEFYNCEKCVSINQESDTATENSVTSAPAKRLKLSLSKEKPRFASPLPEDPMTEISKGKKCINTERSTTWATGVFKQWLEQRNQLSPADVCPEDFLELRHSEDVNRLQKWLCRFIVEARKQDGQSYPTTSLQNLLSGILRYMRNVHGDTPDFLSKKDWRFRELRGTMERIFSDLRKQGVGAEVKHTPIITKEEEDQLWKAKEMGTDTPKQLLQADFFLRGKSVLPSRRRRAKGLEGVTILTAL